MSSHRITPFTLALAAAGLVLSSTVCVAQGSADLEKQLERDLVPAQKPLFALGMNPTQQTAAVEAWVDNPELTYAVGQRLKVFVRPKQNAYITVLNVGSSGRVAVIFPNFYQRDMRVRAGQTVKVPADNATWSINVAGPPGVEVIKVIASKEPLNLVEIQKLAGATEKQPVLTLGRSGDEVARDLVPQLNDPAGNANILPGGIKSLLVRVVAQAGATPAPTFGSQHQPSTFGLMLRTEKPVYRIGETVRVAVAVEKDCHLTLISVGTSGQAVRLFPNPFQTDSVIYAGQTLLIPSLRSPTQFKARGPAGVEGLLATCRGTPSKGLTAVAPLDGFAAVGDLTSVTRDLVAVPAQGGEQQVEQVSGAFLITE